MPRKKPTKKRKRSLASLLEPLRVTFGPRVIATTWLAAAAILGTAWIMGVPRLQVAAAQASWTPTSSVEFVDLPAWVQGDLLAMLELTTAGPAGGDPFDRASLQAARAALLNTGWFDSIEQVQRIRPGTVRVEATFVTPAAVIRDAEGDHLVDPSGRLLPRTYPPDGARHQLVITGAHFDRPSRGGLQWEGADVTSALRLLRLVDGKTWRDQIAAIDAGRYLTEEILVIRTTGGGQIIWGSAPGEETDLEVSAERKLAYLDKANEEYRRIDSGHAGELHFYDRGYFAK